MKIIKKKKIQSYDNRNYRHWAYSVFFFFYFRKISSEAVFWFFFFGRGETIPGTPPTTSGIIIFTRENIWTRDVCLIFFCFLSELCPRRYFDGSPPMRVQSGLLSADDGSDRRRCARVHDNILFRHFNFFFFYVRFLCLTRLQNFGNSHTLGNGLYKYSVEFADVFDYFSPRKSDKSEIMKQ